MEWFSNWWGALNFIEQVLYCVALPSSLLLIIQIILTIVGADGGGSIDIDTSGLDAPGIDANMLSEAGGYNHNADIGGGNSHGDFAVASMFTLQGVASFLCVFGWSALAMYRGGGGLLLWITLPIAFVLGFAVMYASARIIHAMMKLSHTGNLEVKNLLGASATVYLVIPPKGAGKGKVMVQTSERLVEFDAVSEEEAEIPDNAEVRVTDILGGNVLVVERH